MAHIERWPVYGRRFSIYFYTTPLFEAQSPKRLAKVTMAAGLGVSFLATALVAVASRARLRQGELAEQIREARDALAAAQRAREKISRDLHDGTIQSLYAIQLGLGHTVEKLEADPAKAGRGLSAVRKELDAVIAEIRQFITVEAGPDKPVDFSAVLHITREALSNSLRHGKQQRVEITLRLECDTVVLEISDDGMGFDPKVRGRPGVGLASMAARAQEVGGTLEIQSSPGKGTRIVVRVPSEPTEAEWPGASADES